MNEQLKLKLFKIIHAKHALMIADQYKARKVKETGLIDLWLEKAHEHWNEFVVKLGIEIKNQEDNLDGYLIIPNPSNINRSTKMQYLAIPSDFAEKILFFGELPAN